MATGARFGAAFRNAPSNLPVPDVDVQGTIRYEVKRSLASQLFVEPQLGWLYPYDSFKATATFSLAAHGGHQEHWLGFLNKATLKNFGLPGFGGNPAGQLIARIADHLVPHYLMIQPRETPLGFVRRVVNDGVIEVDVGFDSRELTVSEILDVDPPISASPTRSQLERFLLHRYVRVQFSGGPEARARSLWRRINVEEAR